LLTIPAVLSIVSPERLRTVDMNRRHVKSASRCPAVIGLESRYMMVRCPFDLHIGFIKDDKGKPVLKNLMGCKSPVRNSKLNQLLSIQVGPSGVLPTAQRSS
jgi:hypothetical protein